VALSSIIFYTKQLTNNSKLHVNLH